MRGVYVVTGRLCHASPADPTIESWGNATLNVVAASAEGAMKLASEKWFARPEVKMARIIAIGLMCDLDAEEAVNG